MHIFPQSGPAFRVDKLYSYPVCGVWREHRLLPVQVQPREGISSVKIEVEIGLGLSRRGRGRNGGGGHRRTHYFGFATNNSVSTRLTSGQILKVLLLLLLLPRWYMGKKRRMRLETSFLPPSFSDRRIYRIFPSLPPSDNGSRGFVLHSEGGESLCVCFA